MVTEAMVLDDISQERYLTLVTTGRIPAVDRGGMEARQQQVEYKISEERASFQRPL